MVCPPDPAFPSQAAKSLVYKELRNISKSSRPGNKSVFQGLLISFKEVSGVCQSFDPDGSQEKHSAVEKQAVSGSAAHTTLTSRREVLKCNLRH